MSIAECENCRGDNFSFDGRHMICKNCGAVLIREVESPHDRAKRLQELADDAEKKRKEKEEARIRAIKKAASLSGHYERMKGFDDYLIEGHHLDAMR